MIRGVNLLPQDYREVGRRRARRALLGLGLTALLAAAVAVPVSLERRIQDYRRALAPVGGPAADAGWERAARSARRLLELRAAVRVKEAALAAAGGDDGVAAALEALDQAAGGVRLEAFSIEAGGKVTVEGRAAGIPEVVGFLRRLDATGRLAAPRVTFPQPFDATVPFQLTATVAEGGEGNGHPLGGAAR